LPPACPHQQQEKRRSRGEPPKVRRAHKGWDQCALIEAKPISHGAAPNSTVRIILLYLRLRLQS
jgi:hypothetical protein